MPRQRTDYHRTTYGFPGDFTERLKRFQKESGLSWSEIAQRVDAYRHTVFRWVNGRSRPNTEHMMALLAMAQGLGLAHVFTE